MLLVKCIKLRINIKQYHNWVYYKTIWEQRFGNLEVAMTFTWSYWRDSFTGQWSLERRTGRGTG